MITPAVPLSSGVSHDIFTPSDWASIMRRRGADGNDGFITTGMTDDHSPFPDEFIALIAYQ